MGPWGDRPGRSPSESLVGKPCPTGAGPAARPSAHFRRVEQSARRDELDGVRPSRPDTPRPWGLGVTVPSESLGVPRRITVPTGVGPAARVSAHFVEPSNRLGEICSLVCGFSYNTQWACEL